MAPPLSIEMRHEIMALVKGGKHSNHEIASIVGTTIRSVQRLIKRSKERRGNLKTKAGAGRKATCLTAKERDILKKAVKRQPKRNWTQLAKSRKMSATSMRKLAHSAGLKSFRGLVKHKILPGQSVRRKSRSQGLLDWHEDRRNRRKVILYSDEKLFYLDKFHNRQNDRYVMPARCMDPEINSKRIVEKRKNCPSVHVFGLMASDGKVMPPVCFDVNESVNAKTYVEKILTSVASWVEETYGPGYANRVVFQQNGAPAHTLNLAQKKCKEIFGEDGFWRKDQWPPSSPDANPLDFSFWSVLANKICDRELKNRDELIQRIQKNWFDILERDYVAKSCSSVWRRLQRIVAMDGHYFEGLIYETPENNN